MTNMNTSEFPTAVEQAADPMAVGLRELAAPPKAFRVNGFRCFLRQDRVVNNSRVIRACIGVHEGVELPTPRANGGRLFGGMAMCLKGQS